jgi:hypothetical protein
VSDGSDAKWRQFILNSKLYFQRIRIQARHHLVQSNLTEMGECPMYFVAAVLAVLAGLFYAAGNHEIGSWGVEMCRYGSTFCDSPVYVLAGAILAAMWGGFVSVR